MGILHSAYLIARSFWFCIDRHVIERHLRKVGVGYAKCIFTHMTLPEKHALFVLARNCPPNAKILEIGSYLGASTCYLAAGIAQTGGRVFCVDTWSNETMPEGLRDTFPEFVTNIKPISSLVEIIRKRSENLVEDDLVMPLDLVFIDADHSYQAVKGDFQRVSHWLSPTGIIAFHDSRCYEGVSRVVGEALASGRWVLAGCVENLCWIRRAPQSWQAL